MEARILERIEWRSHGIIKNAGDIVELANVEDYKDDVRLIHDIERMREMVGYGMVYAIHVSEGYGRKSTYLLLLHKHEFELCPVHVQEDS
jgi:hypothetical protein